MPRVASFALALLLAVLAGPVAPSGASASSAPAPGPLEGTVDAGPRADATDRWIVVYRPGADAGAANERARGRGIAADRAYKHALKGYAARLTGRQLADVKADPAVAYVVRDEVISVQAQHVPRGVRRTETTGNPLANVDGKDDRVDADVAIFDTGIDRDHEDLNVVGGRNCATSSTGAWGDVNGHGTHVAGTVGALDNGIGVVGVAPGVRLWAVRILDSAGNGLVSWYVCGIDWLTAQREPVPGSETGETRPVIEAVNMSVAKSGSDDANCGLTNKDVIHQAICRLVASGVTVVAAAGNNSFNASRLIPASYNEVITVSALADTDGKSGGKGGNLCYSWGTYDRDDTFADFSNYGGDVDLIAPGKCTWSTLPGDRYGYSSGTSMAAPHVAGAAALYQSTRPGATPSQVRAALMAAATYDWNTGTDPDGRPDRLLNVANIVTPDDYQVDVTSHAGWVNAAGASLAIPVRVFRGENVPDELALTVVTEGPLEAAANPATLAGLTGTSATIEVTVPAGTPTGTYDLAVTATLGDRTRTVATSIRVDSDRPVAVAPTMSVPTTWQFDTTSFRVRAQWSPATDATTAIVAYQAQWRVNGGAWSSSTTLDDAVRRLDRTFSVGRAYEIRVRARDAAGNYSTWVPVSAPYTAVVVQDSSPSMQQRSGAWFRTTGTALSGGSMLSSRSKAHWITRTFTGRAVAWVGVYGPLRGKAEVWVDGTLATTVNLHRSKTHYRRVVFSKAWRTSGEHTIRIVVVGTPDHPRVDLDALVVLK